jgi:hypothetical protein
MLNYDSKNGSIEISEKFELVAATGSSLATPRFDKIGDEYVLTFPNLKKVACFKRFFYDTLGMSSNRYLMTYYRVSRDGNAYSEWFPLGLSISDFPAVDPLHLQVKWVRSGTSEIGTIRLLEYRILGELEREVVDDGSVAVVSPGEEKILKAPYIYKVFRLSGTEIVSGSDLSSTDIKWRYSQDNSRTWSQWEFLTDANVSTARITPVRFFQVEYLIQNMGNSSVSVQDINLLGEFQNVSKDYFKSNLMGIRENCSTNVVGAGYYDAQGNFVAYPNPSGSNGSVSAGLSGDNCQTDSTGSALPKMTQDEKAGLYNPYQQNATMGLLNKLSGDAQQMFGHQVIYFATDPDRKGIDYTLHEYQLYNVACQGDLKVSVDGNNFPDSQIVMNQFDLNLFSTMEVHITKQQFKEVFGPQRRPAKEDFLYFCNLNRMYSVDHAQQFRNFNNSAVYYKLILKKFNMSSNVAMPDAEIRNKILDLTKNSTLDQLMGLDKAEDKASIANKPQHATLTKDPIRHIVAASISKELLENSTTIISKSHYDLSSIDLGATAVTYQNVSPYISETSNFGFYMWFSINNYVVDDVYGFIDYYDTVNSIGWKSFLKNDTISVVTNGVTYSYHLLGAPTGDARALDEDVWYCYVLNIDQRQRELSQWIYKRDVDDESKASLLSGTMLRKVYSGKMDFEPFEAMIESDSCQLIASDMKATNLRLFDDVIPEGYHNKILNQIIIGNDSKNLIFADNANMRLVLPNFPMNE